MSVICLHDDTNKIEESRNRKQFASSGTKAANFEVDHEIIFVRLVLLVYLFS
jgi:hypothetical protein